MAIGGVNNREKERTVIVEQQATAARNAFDKADEDGNGYVTLDEVQGLAEVLGLPFVTPVELDEALETLDAHGDGVLNRDEWVRWWIQRCQDHNFPLEQQEVAARNAFDSTCGTSDGSGTLDQSAVVVLCEQLGLWGPSLDTSLLCGDGRLDEQVAKSLGLQDERALVGREKFVHWYVEQCQNSERQREHARVSSNRDGTGHVDRDEESCPESGGNAVDELTKIARQGRRRAVTDIHTAAWRGDLALVKDFLERNLALANTADNSEFGAGYRPIHYAAYGGFLHVCEALHAAGARVLSAGENGVTPLFLAAQAGKLDIVRFLLSLDADPTVREAESGLCAADVAQDHPEVLDEILRRGDFHVPSSPDAAPVVAKVGDTSLQIVFCGIPTESGQFHPTRYKLKIEQHDGENSGTRMGPTMTGSTSEQAGPDSSNKLSKKNKKKSKVSPKRKKREVSTREEAGLPGTALDHGTDIRGTSRRLAKVVLVLAGGTKRSCEHEEEQKRGVTVRELQPATRYTVQVAAINAVGYGPYGPSSDLVRTLDRGTERVSGSGNIKKKESSNRTALSSSSSSSRVHEEEPTFSLPRRAKGRQALARDKRRMVAEQASQLQEHQRREAEEIRLRRAEKSQGSQATSAPFASITGDSGRASERDVLRTGGKRHPGDSSRLQTQPLPLIHEKRTQNSLPVGRTNNAHDGDEDGDLTQSTDGDNNSGDGNNNTTSSAYSGTISAVPPRAATAPGPDKAQRGRTIRPGRTRPRSGSARAPSNGAAGGVEGRITSDPSRSTRLTETRLHSAKPAHRAENMLTANNVERRRGNRDRGTQPSASGRSVRDSVVQGTRRKRVGSRSREGPRKATEDSESDVDVSSCGDMTISSEEEGEDVVHGG